MELRELRKTALIKIFLSLPFIFAMIFLPAWKLSYWQGWVYFSLNVGILILTVIVLWDKPTILEKRASVKEKMQKWDKVYFLVTTPIYFISVILSVLDVRFNWGPDVNIYFYICGIIIYVVGHAIFLWAKYVNEFLSPVVALQKDQKVCKIGPYRWVRHPSYFAGILFMFSGPLVLGSWLGVIPQVIAILFLIYRTKKEDEFLIENLQGYKEYTNEVKWKLFKGLW